MGKDSVGSQGTEAKEASAPRQEGQCQSCHVHPDVTGVYEAVHQFDRSIKDLTRYLDMLNYETPKSSDNSWTSITASEVGSSSSVSLSPSREDPHSSIMASEASSFAEVSLSPSSDDSWTSIMASDAGCSSQASPSTLLDGENMPHASSVQPSLGHPRADLEEQPGLATQPPCREEVDRCLEVNSMQQNQPDLEIQLGAPTPPPEVLDVHSRETEMPISHHKGQDTLECLIPETKLLQELGQPASVDETPQTVPASAPPSPRQQEKRDVKVDPTVQDLSFLNETVKRQLERHIVKMKIQQRYGLPTRVLEYDKNFENISLGQKATQPPPPQRSAGLPYRSPFRHWDRRARAKKPTGRPPGPQKEFTEPADTCLLGMQAPSSPPTSQRTKKRDVTVIRIVQNLPFLHEPEKRQPERRIVKMPTQQEEPADAVEACPQGTQAPVHSEPAAFLRVAQEMPQEAGETPPCKKEHGVTAGSSTASKETPPETDGKEKGPVTQGDVQGPSPSGQAERAQPEQETAPRGQSGQMSNRPSVSYGDRQPPELLLEKSVPMGEDDLCLEGQRSPSEDVGTAEQPSDLTALPSSSSLQTQHPSCEETPSALPTSPDSARTVFHIPYLEELITALTEYHRASQTAEDLQNQLRALWLEQVTEKLGYSRAELAVEHPSASQSRGHSGAEKGRGSAQDRAGSSGLCPKCSKALRDSLPGSDGSQTWAPSDAATPWAGREGPVGERRPPEDRAKRQQGQKRAAAAQPSQRVHVRGSTVQTPLFRQEWLPARLVPP
ncbi:hypothetical protein GRJ2_001015400 [Grus japonensis]|uniref:Uncharacterized protein n=1 Tax=Grus japonensis TaxID=30415 RepID=A0ABC9WJ42_GRUJA